MSKTSDTPGLDPNLDHWPPKLRRKKDKQKKHTMKQSTKLYKELLRRSRRRRRRKESRLRACLRKHLHLCQQRRILRITEELCLVPDYIHNVSERPRQLSNFDLCLKPTDTDWHIPLIVRVSAHATRNKRTRGTQAQGQQNQRYRDWFYNRQDDSRQCHSQGRYYGGSQRHDYGPYSRSSSSSGHRWDGWYGGWR